KAAAMTAEQRSRITSRAVTGLIIVGAGVAMLLDNLGWIDAGDILRYWPIAVMVLGLVKLLRDSDRSGRLLGGVLLLFGGLSAVDMFYLHDMNVLRWWPLAIVGFGVLIVLKAFGYEDAGLAADVNRARTEWEGRVWDSKPAATTRPGSMAQTMNEV